MYDAYGNFEYGATGDAAGFPLWVLQGAADYRHNWNNNPINTSDISSGFNAIPAGGTLSVVDTEMFGGGGPQARRPMETKPITKIAIAFAAVLAILVMLYSWRADSSQEAAVPSDDNVIRVFHVHRDEFERPRQMATEDRQQTSLFSEVKLSNKLPASRRIEYQSLLKLSPGLEVGANYDGSVRFIFTSIGQAIAPGWAKGIEFVPDTGKVAGIQRETLDDAAKYPAGVYLRKLEPQWFLFFQRDE